MADLYTSFSTSLALRDAGAPPQGGLDSAYWSEDGRLRLPQPPLSRDGWIRSFRADEIVEALGQELCAVFHVEADGAFLWEVELLRHDGLGFPIEAPDVVRGRTLVEALAAAWLAVPKEVKRG